MRAFSVNRIFTLVIVSTFMVAGCNVFAQQPAQSPRQVQMQTEAIIYATERASNVPRYRRYRKPSVAENSGRQPGFGQSSHVYIKPEPVVLHKPISLPPKAKNTLVIRRPRSIERVPESTPTSAATVKAFAKPQTSILLSPDLSLATTDVAPVIGGSSRRITQAVASVDLKQQSQSSTDDRREDLQLGQRNRPDFVQGSEEITPPTFVQRPQKTETAPVVLSSARRITRTKEPKITTARSTEISVELLEPPVALQPVPMQIDIVDATTPSQASPNFKYQRPFEYSQTDFPQSQWTPRSDQVQSAQAATEFASLSPPQPSPPQSLAKVERPDVFEIVSSAFAEEVDLVEGPSEPADLSPAEESPFTSIIEKTTAVPSIKNRSTAQRSAPVAAAASGVVVRTKPRSTNDVFTSAGNETRQQKTAAGAWWFLLPLLVVPFLALLGWAMLGGQRQDQFEEAPTIDIPRQKNASWQGGENVNAGSSGVVQVEDTLQGFDSSPARSFAFPQETELLDEINSISSIASDSNSVPGSTSDGRAKSEK
jgi:hypothetical protein